MSSRPLEPTLKPGDYFVIAPATICHTRHASAPAPSHAYAASQVDDGRTVSPEPPTVEAFYDRLGGGDLIRTTFKLESANTVEFVLAVSGKRIDKDKSPTLYSREEAAEIVAANNAGETEGWRYEREKSGVTVRERCIICSGLGSMFHETCLTCDGTGVRHMARSWVVVVYDEENVRLGVL